MNVAGVEANLHRNKGVEAGWTGEVEARVTIDVQVGNNSNRLSIWCCYCMRGVDLARVKTRVGGIQLVAGLKKRSRGRHTCRWPD